MPPGYCSGENDEAARYLTAAAQARSLRFPVECLNSHMLLAHLHASRGDARSTAEVLDLALSFHQQTKDDFEVRVNFRIKPWLEAARQACGEGALERVRVYPFAY